MDRETIDNMKPYIIAVHGDVKAGKVSLGETNDRGTESESGKPLENMAPEEVGGTGGRGPGGRGTDTAAIEAEKAIRQWMDGERDRTRRKR